MPNVKWLGLSLIVIVLDQLTKWWISTTFELYESIAVMPFFNLTLVHNTGAAFSFLAQAGGWQRWFFTAIAIVVSIVLIVWLTRLEKNQYGMATALSLVLGGAIGNVIDRIAYGYVIDFLDFYYQNWHYPAFNIADMAIVLGAIILLYQAIFVEEASQ